jgi:uncharacterized protein (TIGR02001 family)
LAKGTAFSLQQTLVQAHLPSGFPYELISKKTQEISMNNLRKVLVAGGLLAVSTGAMADISYNAAVTSDYRFRGISQSAQDPALQGGVDWTDKSGFYAGAWGSTIDFGNELPDSSGAMVDPDANIEVDLYGGYKFKSGPVEYDVGAIYYAYPGSESDTDLDFFEIYFGGTYGPAFAKLFYTPDVTTNLSEEEGFYLSAGANIDVGGGYTLNLGIGYSFGDGVKEAAGETYLDWKIGVTKEFYGFTFNLAYIGNDISSENEFTTDEFNTEDTVVLTVSKTF